MPVFSFALEVCGFKAQQQRPSTQLGKLPPGSCSNVLRCDASGRLRLQNRNSSNSFEARSGPVTVLCCSMHAFATCQQLRPFAPAGAVSTHACKGQRHASQVVKYKESDTGMEAGRDMDRGRAHAPAGPGASSSSSSKPSGIKGALAPAIQPLAQLEGSLKRQWSFCSALKTRQATASETGECSQPPALWQMHMHPVPVAVVPAVLRWSHFQAPAATSLHTGFV
jgi:hypothetical protein